VRVPHHLSPVGRQAAKQSYQCLDAACGGLPHPRRLGGAAVRSTEVFHDVCDRSRYALVGFLLAAWGNSSLGGNAHRYVFECVNMLSIISIQHVQRNKADALYFCSYKIDKYDERKL
jgi:hypothetical protein